MDCQYYEPFFDPVKCRDCVKFISYNNIESGEV